MKTLIVACAIVFTSASNAAPEPIYQITSTDTTYSKLVQRWADIDKVGFEWNVRYDFPIDFLAVSNIEDVNTQLARADTLAKAVQMLLTSLENKKPSLATCYFKDEAILIYTKGEPNCGHVEPTPDTVDDE